MFPVGFYIENHVTFVTSFTVGHPLLPGQENRRTAVIFAEASSGTCGPGIGRPTIRPAKSCFTSGAKGRGGIAAASRRAANDRR
jgi:hypothetical protein